MLNCDCPTRRFQPAERPITALRRSYQETYLVLRGFLQAGQSPHQDDLARAVGLTRRGVQLQLQRLEAAGALVVTRKRDGSNTYALPLDQQAEQSA